MIPAPSYSRAVRRRTNAQRSTTAEARVQIPLGRYSSNREEQHMLYGHLGPLYWGRCTRKHNRDPFVVNGPYVKGLCFKGFFIEWHR